jgi:ADP-ribose pyrophosphatase
MSSDRPRRPEQAEQLAQPDRASPRDRPAETTAATSTSYRGYVIDVVSEEVELPNGHRVGLDLIRHPGAAAVVPFLSPDEVLLIRQYRHAAGGMILEVPAGKLDPGESPADCAVRELAEETGRQAGRVEDLGWIFTTPGFTDERIHLFAAFDLTPVPRRPEDDEIIDLVPMSLADAVESVWNGEIRDAKSALALLQAARRLGQLSGNGGRARHGGER